MFKKLSATSGADFSEQPPAGTHPAVIVAVIGTGTHEDTYQGETSDADKLYLVWELTAEKKSQSSMNYTIGKEYTIAFSKKAALRKLVETFRGKPYADGEEFDPEKLVGVKCLLSVSHKPSGDRTFANVDGMTAVPKGMTVPAPGNKPFCWAVGCGLPTPENDWLPFIFGQSVKDRIADSKEVTGKPRLARKGKSSSSNLGTPSGSPVPEPVGAGASADSVPF